MSSVIMKTTTITLEQLAKVIGGADKGGMLNGDVNQRINTNWGGTMIINEAEKSPTGMVDFMRKNPQARLDAMRRQSTPVHRGGR